MKRFLALAMLLQLAILAATPVNVVGEIFTEVCSGCGGDYSVARSALIQLSQENERLYPVIWQMTDPQSPGAQDRYDWYNGSVFPHAVFGGTTVVAGEYDPLNDYYDAYMEVFELESPLEIAIEAHRTATGDMQILADVAVTGDVTTNDNQVFFLVTQNDLSNYHGLVVARSSNEAINLAGRTEIEHTFDWDASWDEGDLRGLVIVQSYDTGEVLQSAQAKITVVGVDDTDIEPAHGQSMRVWPNPFNPETTVRFSLAQGGETTLAVYNVRGQRVRSLVNEPLEAGTHSVVWDGKNTSGEPVASGVYFVRLTAGDYVITHKMALLK
ncbi:MAG: T9SS type A sorting domain-containing protein [Candidatus Cloacimonetes bacterium]|nr:T9SS type A sorting domain-containing protein [Candidatus Cloacimonadota bacterium]